MSEDVAFNCYHSGKFEASDHNMTAYIGGEVHTLYCKGQDFYDNLKNALGEGVATDRIWYKLPFETFSELKLLWSGGDNFRRMCEASRWTSLIEIFMEKKDDEEVGATVNDEEGNVSEKQSGGDANELERNEEGEMLDEEIRIEENVGGFVDEAEEYNDEVTPMNSDGEEEGELRYDRYRKGSGVIKLKQVFPNIPAFKEAVVEYSLKEGYNVKHSRWGHEKSEVKCSIGGGCPFRIYCSFDEPSGMFMVKTFKDTHSCIKDGRSKVIKDGVIAKLFLDDIRKNPKFKPKDMQDQLEDRFNLVLSNDQCRKGKTKALKIIQQEHDEQYARLRDYALEIQDSNPGSTVELVTATGDGDLVKFDKMYICFDGLRRAWLAHCRPILGIDGCFLKNNSKEQLLAAVGRDPNNQFYPVAWAVVQTENEVSWESYNNAVNKAREMPLVEMLETVKRLAMLRIDIRKRKAQKHKGKYSEKVAKVIAEEERHRKFCRAIPGPNGKYEVSERNHCFRVDIPMRTCTCRRWNMTGIPCRHALKVISLMKYNAEDYVSDAYLTSKWVELYEYSILPHNGINLWRRSEQPRLAPPAQEVSLGPKKVEKRKKGKNESPKKKRKCQSGDGSSSQVKLIKRFVVHCGRCGQTGHNKATCTGVGADIVRPKKVPKQASQASQSEVPSETTQASQASQCSIQLSN